MHPIIQSNPLYAMQNNMNRITVAQSAGLGFRETRVPESPGAG
jgi:hypothetical protein